MVRAALVALAPAALAAATAGATVASSFSPGLGHAGCVKVMTSVCGADWKTKHQLCVDCVTAHMSELEPNCTQQEALNHCDNPPGSSPGPSPSPGPSHVPDPPAPPAPPATPRAGAPQPHLILFVVDDQGAANVGFK